MGYRSDVTSGIFANTDEALTGLVTAARLEGLPKDTIEEFERVRFADHVYALIYTANDVKWYDSYTEVREHHEFLDFAESKGFATAFVRIGEDDNDIQNDYSYPDEAEAPGYDIYPYEYLSVSRSIEVANYESVGRDTTT